MRRLVLLAGAALALSACATDGEDVAADEGAVTLDTASAEARAQYDANVAYALEYTPRCAPGPTGRPRVVVVGFGRFKSSSGVVVNDNASGRVVSALVPEARYPDAPAPRRGRVDPPGPQVSVAQADVDLRGYGAVEVCAMILPVSWDLAAVLVAKEIDSFAPSFVIMNGVAAERQAIWIELGAVNRGNGSYDGTSTLRPALQPGERYVKLVEEAGDGDDVRGNLLSWGAVQTSAREAFDRHADERDRGGRFGDIATGVIFPGFPRTTGTYVCNNLSYVTGWLMDHPGAEIDLMKATPPREGARSSVPVSLQRDMRDVPRVFVHWPRDLAEAHHEAAADVMSAMIAGQLRALDAGVSPTRGTREQADASVRGSDFY